MKYKLVPVKPTREMWAAAGDAVVALNSQHHDAISEAVYKAMLAAAPDFDRHVIAEVNEDDDGYWADILPDRSVHLGQPLYAVMQPSPEVAKLIRLLDSARLYVVDVLKDPYSSVSHAFAKADLDQIDAAIAAYRQQGGDL